MGICLSLLPMSYTMCRLKCFEREDDSTMFCKRCRYNLSQLESRACPECGRAFDPANARTFRKNAGWPKWTRHLRNVFLFGLVAMLIAMGVLEWRYQQEIATTEKLHAIGGRAAWMIEWSNEHEWSSGVPFLHQRLQHIEAARLPWGDGLLPERIEAATRFRDLNIAYLDYSQLPSLPPEIGKLANLKKLILNENRLTTVPPEIGNLKNLEVLSLWGNQLTSLPPEIGQLSNLWHLHLGGNQLSTLPKEIGALKSLVYISINDNDLDSIPTTIGQLSNLESLHLNRNNIATLPVELGNLKHLTNLFLEDNPITDDSVPLLSRLTSLIRLNVLGTKLTKDGVLRLQKALPNCSITSDH